MTAKSLSQDELSQLQMRSTLQDEFEEVQKTEFNQRDNRHQFESLLNEINTSKKLKAKNLSILEQKLDKVESQQVDVHKANDCELHYEEELDRKMQLDIEIQQWVHSVNKIKKDTYPIEELIAQLKIQERQAIREAELAVYELTKITRMTAELQNQMAVNKKQKSLYLKYMYSEKDRVEDQRHNQIMIFEDQIKKIDILRDEIAQQRSLIRTLERDNQQKWIDIAEQNLLLKQYQAIMRLYQFCTEQTDRVECSDSESNQDIQDISEDSIIGDDFFQTAVNFKSYKINTVQPANEKDVRVDLLNMVNRDTQSLWNKANIILESHKSQSIIKQQLVDKNHYLLQLKDEYELTNQELYDKVNFVEIIEDRIYEGIQTSDNFNQTTITKNIMKNGSMDLAIKKQADKQLRTQELFFTLNTRSLSQLKRLTSMLQFIHIKANKQQLFICTQINQSLSLMQHEYHLNFDNYPKFKKMFNSNALTRHYTNQYIFNDFISQLDIKDDDHLSDNFVKLCELCIHNIASESNFLLEQIGALYMTVKEEMKYYEHVHRSNALIYPFPSQIQITYNTAARKLQDYADSKMTDIQSKRRNDKKSLLNLPANWQVNTDEVTQDYVEDLYFKVKNFRAVENVSQTQSLSKTRSTLYEVKPNAMQDIVKQNKEFSKSIKRIQSESTLKGHSFRDFLEKEKKQIDLLTRMSRVDSTNTRQTERVLTATPATKIEIKKFQMKTFVYRPLVTRTAQGSRPEKSLREQMLRIKQIIS